MATQTLHFSIGEGYGTLITQIAREKLIEDKDVEGAIDILVDTTGMERKMAFEIILGYKTLHTDVDTQELSVDPKEMGEINKDYVLWNYKRLEHKLRRFSMDAKSMKYYLQNEVVKAKRKSIYLTAEVLVPYFNTDDMEEIRNEVNHVHRDLKDYYEGAISLLNRFGPFFKWLVDSKKASDKYGVLITQELADATLPMPEQVVYLHTYVQELESAHVVDDVEPVLSPDLDKYIQGYKNLEALHAAVKSKAGLEPKDPKKEKWDAGYISPEGEYYAVNGEIANMLHLNLADAMVRAGIIPEDFDGETNADVWLERRGWVKQHGDHILYAGYDNHKVGGVDVPITKAQLTTITTIIRHWYNGIIWPGFNRANRCSVMSWASSEPLQFRLKWFAW